MRKSLLGETLILSWVECTLDPIDEFEIDKDYYRVHRDCTDEDITFIEEKINQLKGQGSVSSWVLSRHIVSSDY